VRHHSIFRAHGRALHGIDVILTRYSVLRCVEMRSEVQNMAEGGTYFAVMVTNVDAAETSSSATLGGHGAPFRSHKMTA